MKKTFSLLLALIMLFGTFNIMPISIYAHAEDERVSDPSTLDDWKHLFGEDVAHTGNAGAVWSDKSVLTDPTPLGVRLDDPDNFAVALSAIASHKSVVGYTGIPTDTMIVVDMAVSSEVLNSAIKEILSTNNYNRVGVLVCSAEHSLLLPVDRYSEDATFASDSEQIKGIENIQKAVFTAMQQLTSLDTVIGDGIQSGTKRMPSLIVISDDIPDSASSSYMAPDKIDIKGEAQSAFATQLTFAYVKTKIEEHYGRSALLYTVGGENAVLKPESSSHEINDLWSAFDSCSSGTAMQLSTDSGYRSVVKTTEALSQNYVNEYYKSGDDALMRAVAALMKNALYYPTYVEGDNSDLGGYIEFIDDIGRYMEVKDIKGIKVGDLFFTGEALSRNFLPDGGELGSVSAPNDLGNEMIWSVMDRLGIESLATAQQLVNLAYRSGQLSYNSDTGEFSNYIGWYADEDGDFISHGTDSHLSVPDNAVFYNKSYGFLGRAAEGYNSSDLMYVSVQVHTRIATGTQAVIFRIPAALIPVITYNISFTGESLDDPGDITLTYNDKISVDTTGDNNIDSEMDIQPVRLIYEVGLKENIDDITVHDIVDDNYEHIKDGVYTFYTNRWDVNDLNHAHPSEAKNTVAFFTPSTENERYYYTENTDIYVLSGENYVKYEGLSAPSYEEGKYFRAHNVFEYSDEVSGGNAVIHTHYEEMTERTLSKAEKGSNGWYIPKGTVYRFFDDHAHTKNENTTDTIEYSHLINVEKIDDAGEDALEYYVDFILGNNGKMTLKAAQGIEITSSFDSTLKGRENTVTFEIKGPDGRHRLVKYSPDGHKTELTFEIVDGKGTFDVLHGEKAYIVDLPTGKAYNISELTEGREYVVKTVNGDVTDNIDVTVTENKIESAEFLNTLSAPLDSGVLVLYNEILHPFGADADTSYHRFTYDVSYSDHTETVQLRDKESIIFRDIPLGTKVTVTETDLPTGFSCDREDACATLDITEAGVYVLDYINKYTPEAVTGANITMTGDIELTGRALMTGDEFIYKLQKLNGTEWVDMATATATASDPSFDFSEYIQAESFGSAGVYTYRIAPVIDQDPYCGITYDKTVRWFEVVVTDNDWNGRYEIYSILGFSGAIVSKNSNKWGLHASFFSDYSTGGSDTVTLRVHTQVDQKADADLSGYLYGLYQNGELVQLLPASSYEGESELVLSYGASEIGNTVEYTVKAVSGDNTDIAYSDKEYTISVTLTDNMEGGVKATVTYDGVASKEAELTFIHTYIAPETDNPAETTTDITVNTDKIPDTTKKPEKPSTSPLTGDKGVILWVVIMTASIFCFTVVCLKKKRT